MTLIDHCPRCGRLAKYHKAGDTKTGSASKRFWSCLACKQPNQRPLTWASDRFWAHLYETHSGNIVAVLQPNTT